MAFKEELKRTVQEGVQELSSLEELRGVLRVSPTITLEGQHGVYVIERPSIQRIREILSAIPAGNSEQLTEVLTAINAGDKFTLADFLTFAAMVKENYSVARIVRERKAPLRHLWTDEDHVYVRFTSAGTNFYVVLRPISVIDTIQMLESTKAADDINLLLPFVEEFNIDNRPVNVGLLHKIYKQEVGSEDDFVAVKSIFDSLVASLSYYFLPDVIIEEGDERVRFSLATLVEEGQNLAKLLY